MAIQKQTKKKVTNGDFKQVTGILLSKLGEMIKPLNPCADVFQRFPSLLCPSLHIHIQMCCQIFIHTNPLFNFSRYK